MARILGASLLTVVLAAGCTTVTTQIPGGSGASSPIPTSTTTPPSAVLPTGQAPAATADAICQSGPLTVAGFLAADPRCYVTDDVSVVGWWDAVRQPFADANSSNAPAHVLRGAIPAGPWLNERPDEFLLVDDDASQAIATGGWAEGMHWATVTGRRSSDNSAACYRDPGDDIWAAPRCPSYLIAASVVASEPPASALAGCSSSSLTDEGSSIAVETFTAFPAACFGSREVRLRGWFDIVFMLAGWTEGWEISPGWLWVPIGPWTVLAPGSTPPNAASTLVVYVDPARKVDVSRTNRWVELTGHYADAKAATCHVEYTAGYEPAPQHIPDSFARRLCEGHFVVTSIRDTP